MARDPIQEFEAQQDELALSQGTALTAGSTIQQTKARYTTAISVQNPRQLPDVRKRFLQECQMAGEAFYYSWSVGNNNGKSEVIEGPSIGMAMALVRSFGNCVVDTTEVREDDKSYVIISSFIDLETGATISRPYRQSKFSQVAGRMDRERKDDVRFQIAASKSMRNVVLNALPKWLIDQGMQAAKKGTRDKLIRYIEANGIAKAIEHVCKALNGLGVEEQDICARMGVAETKALDVDALVLLRGDLTTIQNGEDYAENIFPTIAQRKSKQAPDVQAARQEIEDEFANITNGKRDELNAFFAEVGGEAKTPQATPAATEPESDATDAEQPADATGDATDSQDANADNGTSDDETIAAWKADERYAGLPTPHIAAVAKAKTKKTIDARTEEFSIAITPDAEASESDREAADLLIAAAADLAETAKETLAARKGK